MSAPPGGSASSSIRSPTPRSRATRARGGGSSRPSGSPRVAVNQPSAFSRWPSAPARPAVVGFPPASPDIQDAARSPQIGIAFGQRDAAVDDDRTIPMAGAALERGDEASGARIVHAQAAARVVDIEQSAGENREI